MAIIARAKQTLTTIDAIISNSSRTSSNSLSIPVGIGNITSWYAADRGLISNNTTNRVEQWFDQSGFGIVLSQASPTRWALRGSDYTGGYVSIGTSGSTNEFMNMSGIVSLFPQGTLYMIVKSSAVGAVSQCTPLLTLQSNEVSNSLLTVDHLTSATFTSIGGAQYDLPSTTFSSTVERTMLLKIDYNSTSQNMIITRIQQEGIATQAFIGVATAPSFDRLGVSFLMDYTGLKIYEMISFSTLLSAAQDVDMKTYFDIKYNLGF